MFKYGWENSENISFETVWGPLRFIKARFTDASALMMSDWRD